jgi:glutamate-1-semialdehyde aminotransferase
MRQTSIHAHERTCSAACGLTQSPIALTGSMVRSGLASQRLHSSKRLLVTRSPWSAGLATIDVLEHAPVHQHIERLARGLRQRLSEISEENGFEAQTTGVGSLFAIQTTRNQPLKDAKCQALANHDLSRKIFSYMLQNNILMLLPDVLHGAISYSDTADDINRLASVIERCVKRNS